MNIQPLIQKLKKAGSLITAIKTLILKNKMTKIISLITVPLVVIIVTAVLVIFSSPYKLAGSIKFAADLTPAHASYYIEIVDPGELSDILQNTPVVKKIKESDHWRLFMQTPEMMKISNMFYLLEMQSGSIIGLDNFTDLFDGPVGISGMQNGSVLLAAKTNLKSKIGLALLTAFKGEKVQLQKEEKQKPVKNADDSPKTVVSDSTFKDLYQQEDVNLRNIKVTRFMIEKKPLYLTIVDDILFISNNLNTIEESLITGSKKDNNSLKSMPAISRIYSNLRTNNVILYLNNTISPVAPLLCGLSDTMGSLFVFNVEKDKLLSADIFEITEYTQEDKKANEAPAQAAGPVNWEKIISQDTAAVLFSRKLGFNELINNILKLKSNWNELNEGIAGFLKAASINSNDYFKPHGGMALALNDLDIQDSLLYPAFTLGYNTSRDAESLCRAIFKVTEKVKRNYQNNEYLYFNTKAAGNGFYKPALFSTKDLKLLSSLEKDTINIISAHNGNSPVLSDLESFKILGKHSDAPHHLIINIPKALSSLKKFYHYGALRSNDYSSITIERDIVPLIDTFSQYKILHVSFGKTGEQSGRLVITE